MSNKIEFITYAKFHSDNIFQSFYNIERKIIESKLVIFCRHRKDTEKLRRITAGTDEDYKHVDKPGCVNGVIVNLETYENYYYNKITPKN